jgi:hypothetical protein
MHHKKYVNKVLLLLLFPRIKKYSQNKSISQDMLTGEVLIKLDRFSISQETKPRIPWEKL